MIRRTKTTKTSKPRTNKYNASAPVLTEGADNVIKLRSGLELFTANLMTKNGLYFHYEPFRVALSPDITNFCHWDCKKGNMVQKCKHKAMRYTPDFVVMDDNGNWTHVIEAKGMVTEAFSLRWKFFKIWLAKHFPDCIAYIGYSQKDITNIIDHIKETLRK